MFLKPELLLLVNMISGLKYWKTEPDPHCDYNIAVGYQQVIRVNNPNWPNTYHNDIVCRWTFDCPIGSRCRIRCRNVGLPKTKKCFLDYLLISQEGNMQFKHSHKYCGHTKVNVKSVSTRLVLGLVANEDSPGGRFSCKVKPEPWS